MLNRHPVDVKLTQHHKGWAALRIYANQPIHPLHTLCVGNPISYLLADCSFADPIIFLIPQSEDETEDSFLSNWRRSGLSYTQAEAEAGDSAWDSAVADLTGTK